MVFVIVVNKRNNTHGGNASVIDILKTPNWHKTLTLT